MTNNIQTVFDDDHIVKVMRDGYTGSQIFHITDENRMEIMEQLSICFDEAVSPSDPEMMAYLAPSRDDWYKPDPMIRRYCIAIEAVAAGASVVDVGNHHGVLVNNWLLVAVKTNKWTYTMKDWYYFGTLEALFKKHITDKLVEVDPNIATERYLQNKLDQIAKIRESNPDL